MLSELASMMDS